MGVFGSIGKMAARAVELEVKLPGLLRGFTRPLVRPLRIIKQWLHTSRDGKVHLFRNIGRGWKASSTRRWNNFKKFIRSPFKSTGRAIKNLAIGLAVSYAANKVLKTLMGGDGSNGNVKNSAPSFDAPQITPAANQTIDPSIHANDSSRSGDIKKSNAVAKVDLDTKIASAKAELYANRKQAYQIGTHVDRVPDKVESIYAKGNTTNDRLDAIIKLLNKGNEIQNESRRLQSQLLKIEEQKIKSELEKSSELYRNLMKVQAQQNSANSDSIRTAVQKSATTTSSAIKAQTSEYKRIAMESKKSSVMKWLLFGSMLYGINSLVKSFGGFTKLWGEASDRTGSFLQNIGESIGLIKDDMDSAVKAGTETYKPGDEPKDDDKDDLDSNKSFKDKFFNSIDDLKEKRRQYKEEKERKERLQNAIDKTSDKIEQRSDSNLGKTGADSGLAATMAAQVANHYTPSNRIKRAEKNLKKAQSNLDKLRGEYNASSSNLNKAKARLDRGKKLLDNATRNYNANPTARNKKLLDKATELYNRGTAEVNAATKSHNKLGKAFNKAEKLASKASNKYFSALGTQESIANKIQAVKNAGQSVGTKIAESKLGKATSSIASAVKNSAVAKVAGKVTDKLKINLLGKLMKTLGVKLAAKAGGKLIPGLGIGIGAISAVKRMMRGDWIGAFGDISSTAIAQAGYLGTILFPGVATAAGIAASAGIDALVAMHDRKLAEKAIDEGDIKTLVGLGFEWGDLAAIVYGLEGDPEYEGLPANNPLRQALDKYFPTIMSIIKSGGNWTAVLGTAAQLRDCKIKNEFNKKYSTIDDLLKLGLNWVEIAEVVNATPDGHPLRTEFAKALSMNPGLLDHIMRHNSRINNVSITMANIMKKRPDTSAIKKEFIRRYGDLDSFIDSESKIKNSWSSKALKWMGNTANSLGKAIGQTAKKSADLVRGGLKGIKNLQNDIWADVAGIFGGGKSAKKAKEERLAKAKRYEVMAKMADEEGILLSEGGKERGSIDFEEYYKLNKDKVDALVKESPDKKSVWDKIKSGAKWAGKGAINVTKKGIRLLDDYAIPSISMIDLVTKGELHANKSARHLINGAKSLGKGAITVGKAVNEGVETVGKAVGEGAVSGYEASKDAANYVYNKAYYGTSAGATGENTALEGFDPSNVATYAEGTKSHPGGPAIVGDGGKNEVIITPDNKAVITPDEPTLIDLPKGSKVIPEVSPMKFDTPKITKSSRIRGYINGTDDPYKVKSGDVPELLARPEEDETPLEDAVTQIPSMSDRDKRILAAFHWMKANTDLQDHQIAGVIGVMLAESNMDPQAYMKAEKYGTAMHKGIKFLPKGYGAGICQWTSPNSSDTRKADILNYINKTFNKDYTEIEQSSLGEQLAAFKYEIKTKRPKTYRDLKNSESLWDATKIMLSGYENGGDGKYATEEQLNKYTWANGYKGLMETRTKLANDALKVATGHTLDEGEIANQLSEIKSIDYSNDNKSNIDFDFNDIGGSISKLFSSIANDEVFKIMNRSAEPKLTSTQSTAKIKSSLVEKINDKVPESLKRNSEEKKESNPNFQFVAPNITGGAVNTTNITNNYFSVDESKLAEKS